MRTHGRLTSHDSSPLSPRAHTTRGGVDGCRRGSMMDLRVRRRVVVVVVVVGWMDGSSDRIDRSMDADAVDGWIARRGRAPESIRPTPASRRFEARVRDRGRAGAVCVCVCVCVCVFLRVMYAYSSVYSVVVWDDD